ncbi:hypothetical protein F5X68DRAFT_129195 [Plectosphaerella plurivora]|uniref:Saponin hydrolase n=1 Tax=Plectosphaerella plurivora TaxID=936078 RepID=A0A9P8VJC0_9PEZI|nr:hypothetical protein F5X68DRAFT_129195 [Plectosphaerella plurivora]
MWTQAASLLLVPALVKSASCDVPPPPEPEPIEVVELPLPPVLAEDATTLCTSELNPRGTGCIAQRGGGSTPETVGIMAPGDFLPDNKHVIVLVTFTGAPAAPDPASIYDGEQIILVKTDEGDVFPNGDPWKCVTCGIPPEHRVGMTHMLDYPQDFGDGKRILAGDNIIDCGENLLASEDCDASNTFVYPIRWETTAEGSNTTGGAVRELRIHADNVHLGFSAFYTADGKLGQNAYFSRLVFNPSPTSGLPLAPRYDLHNVTKLRDPEGVAPISVSGDSLFVNHDAITVGELRGFSGRGHEAIYVGSPQEAGNTDVFAVHLQTGHVRRLTTHPEYVDPIDISPDDEWSVILDTRATTRHMFLAGLQGLPPLTDIVAAYITTGVRNNGPRRFFQPWLLDKHGDRGDYYGQKINGPGNGVPGSGDIDDPEWNSMADPKWSPDGTKIAWWQAQTIAPACGGENPLPCYPSTADGGRTYRLMMAKLTSREPLDLPPVEEASDEVPWGVPYVPGSQEVGRAPVPAGDFVLKGSKSGFAEVSLLAQADPSTVDQVIVVYNNYSDDGLRFINGWENVTEISLSPVVSLTHWYSDIVQTGEDGYLATKKSGPGGWHCQLDITRNFIISNGTLTTTINGVEYYPPQSGT